MDEVTVIDEPHDAIAASRCLTARSLDSGRGAITAQHPRRCTWCAIDLAELTRRIEGWNTWAAPQDHGRSTVYERHAARTFVEWSRRQPAEAEALIVAAQGLVEATGGTHTAAADPAEPSASVFPGDGAEPVFSGEPMDTAATSPAHDPATVEEDVTAWM